MKSSEWPPPPGPPWVTWLARAALVFAFVWLLLLPFLGWLRG